MFCPTVKLIEFLKVSAPFGNDYRHNSLDFRLVICWRSYNLRFSLKIASIQICFLRLMINSPQLYRQFKEVERPTCYHYEGREGGRAHVEGDDQTPQFMCSKHLNCQIISIYCHHPKVPSSTGTRPRGVVLVSAVRHRVSRIRAHLSVSHCGGHQLNIDIFFHRFIFIAVTDITQIIHV